jgi:hypothetical protein
MYVMWVVTTAFLPPNPGFQLANRFLFGPAALGVYCALTSSRVSIARIPIGIVMGAAAIGVFKPGYCGERSLYLLGLGGGIPVAAIMKPTLGPDHKGCLIVNMGGRFVIWPTDNPTERTCRNLVPESTPILALSHIVTLSQTDILRVEPAPEHQPTVVFD